MAAPVLTSKMALAPAQSNVLGARPPIVKRLKPIAVTPPAATTSNVVADAKPPVVKESRSPIAVVSPKGARPPIVKRALPPPPISVAAGAVPILKRVAKTPLKQAVKKSSKGK